MKSFYAPIALFVYNRPSHTQKTVEALLKNQYSDQSDLVIFADGAKSEANNAAVKEVRNYIHSIVGFKSIRIIESETNKGLADSIIHGVTKVLSESNTIIVLEDDIETGPHFLSFMNQALITYKYEENVISIHGYVYPLNETMPETFFLRGAYCWGWATWKRGWMLFEPDGRKLLREVLGRKLKSDFDFDNSYPFTKMLRDQIKGRNNSWSIRWQASAFLNDKLTLFPGKSLVKNIGFDSSGTHSSSGDKEYYDTVVDVNSIVVEKIKIEESILARESYSKFFQRIHISIPKRIIRKVRKIYNKIMSGNAISL